MADLDFFRSCGEELERRLRLRTFPLAVRLLENEQDIPDGAKRPMKDFGHHLSLCQAYAMSRREGVAIAVLKEDMWCSYPVIGYGLAEPPEYFLDGHSCYPGAKSTKGARNWARAFPRLETGKYIGIASAPLEAANFEPDVIILYCNSAQLGELLSAAAYKEGHEITSRLGSDAACNYYVVPVIQSGEYHVNTPCGGDRRRAMAQDDEMVFTVPKAKLGDLLLGIRCREEAGLRFPRSFTMMFECDQPGPYVKTSRLLGMHIDK